MEAPEMTPLKDVACPLCGSKGSLQVVTPRDRLRAGPVSLLLNLGMTHRCEACQGRVRIFPFAGTPAGADQR